MSKDRAEARRKKRDESKLKVVKKNPLLEIERFEGVCPECGQPFLAEYVNALEDKVMLAIESIKSLETILQLKDRRIKELESKKLVLVRTKIDVRKN